MEIQDLGRADVCNLDFECVRLDLHMTAVASARSVDPEDYIRSVSADIMVYHGGHEMFYKAGAIEASIILFDEAEKNGLSKEQVLADASESQWSMFEHLFSEGRLNNKVRYGSAAIGNNMLMIDLVEVDESVRGHDIGLMALRSFLELFGKHIVVLKAFPLQHGIRSEDQVNDDEFEADQYKLFAYYERINFQQVGTTDYMFLKTVAGLPNAKYINPDVISIPAF